MRLRSPLGEFVAVGALVLGAVAGCGDSPATPDDGGTVDASDADPDGATADAYLDGGSDPDIVVITGGTWPDSATGTCANSSGPIACPGSTEALYGQDGTYRVAVPSYTMTTETVVDTVTSLMWERLPDDVARNQADATAHCAALSLGGHNDWRLPSRLEHLSLMDYGRTSGGALPAAFNAPASGGARWTSSASARVSGAYFVVNENYGASSIAVSTNTLRSRCVRGGALAGTKQANADTVVDSLTGLEWQRTSLDDTEISWEAAIAYCEALVHAGHNDWRLPNIKELATIVDETGTTAPTIDQSLFGTSAATAYWSSSPSLLFPGYAYVLQTDPGISPNRDMSLTASARCVRQAN